MNKMPRTIQELREQRAATPSHLEHSALLYMMHELSRLISVYFDQAMARHNLTHAQWWALMHINENEGLKQTELADIMQMGRASAGKLLERLERKGWIERRPDERDQRVRRVYLCDPAVPVFVIMTQEGGRMFNALLGNIDPEEEAMLLAGLTKIRANAEHSVT